MAAPSAALWCLYHWLLRSGTDVITRILTCLTWSGQPLWVCKQFSNLKPGSVNPSHYHIICSQQHVLNQHCTSLNTDKLNYCDFYKPCRVTLFRNNKERRKNLSDNNVMCHSVITNQQTFHQTCMNHSGTSQLSQWKASLKLT